jgi:proteasome accessory factor C
MSQRRGPRSAAERLRRLLVMVPWVMERGEVTVAEVAERFQLTEKEVINDLERVAMCGVPPYGPDDLVDLFVDEGVVYAGASRIFTRPLRLTTPEGFALLAAGRAGMELPGAEPGGPLARALDKLERTLGAPDLDVSIAKPALADDVARAVEDRAQLRLTYWSAAKDTVIERVVDPQAVFSDRGNWYLLGDDQGAAADQ